ncbi:MAG TPA: trypsin-like serine protease [bacterium]|jgi:hypothetical protein|nr:trypsin-like serine protease [bacterium]
MISIAVLAAATLAAGPVGAITYGQPDGTGHPNVGALIAEWSTPGVKEILCSGTLIATRVFLTAAHCTAFLESLGIPNTQIWVSFDQDADPVTASTNLIQGQWITNPGFNQRQSDPGDVAVVLFSQNVQGITPAQLPTAGLFDQLGPRGLRRQKFTAVGYGVQAPEIGGGPPNWPFDGMRWKAVSEFRALTPAWLRLSQNDATNDGGTCFGDSGGPNFLGADAGETPVVAAITITGDAMCLATNVTYRLDRPAPRNFLANFVVLP